MDMGIVNAGMLEVYEEIEPELKELVEDVLLNRRPDATERLVEFGEKLKAAGAASAGDEGDEKKVEEWRNGTVEERLSHCAGEGNRRVHRGGRGRGAREAGTAAGGD